MGGCSKAPADLPAESGIEEETEAPNAVTQAEATLLGENSATGSKLARFPFFVYQDAGISAFVPDGWMGDYNDIKLNIYWEDNTHSGKTCMKIVYLPNQSQNSRWAGVYWQFPGNQWGKRRGGYDLTGAKKLSFWARGEKGGEVIQEIKMGGISGKYMDSDSSGIGPIVLTSEWREFQIDLTGVDLSYISGGFCWATNLDRNPSGCTFYLDDIVYE